MNFKDVELLSAYLDGQLSPSDSTRLTARLATDRKLASVLLSMREARGLLRHLPPRRVPRNFTLTRKTAGLIPPEPKAYPGLRFASLLATLLLFFTLATNAIAPRVALRAAAPYGIGGGGWGGAAGDQTAPQESAPAAATEIPPGLQSFAATAPTATPEAAAQNAMPLAPQSTEPVGALPAPGAEPSAKAASPATEASPLRVRNQAPVPALWQFILAAAALLFAGAAWILNWVSGINFWKRNR